MPKSYIKEEHKNLEQLRKLIMVKKTRSGGSGSLKRRIVVIGSDNTYVFRKDSGPGKAR